MEKGALTLVLAITMFVIVTNTEDKIIGIFFGFSLGFFLGGIAFLAIHRWRSGSWI